MIIPTPLRALIRITFLFAVALLLPTIGAIGQDGSLDPTFDPGTGCQEFGKFGSVKAIAVQPDGKILIAGIFEKYDRVGRNSIARLNADGSLDPSFVPVVGPNGYVQDLLVQADGKILICGSFSRYDEVPREKVARLNADGTLDITFDPGTGPNATVYNLNQQADGKVIISGTFLTVNGTDSKRVARLNTDGSLDPGFLVGGGFSGSVFSAFLQPDGKLLATGFFSDYAGNPSMGLARLNVNGSFDTSFTPQTSSSNNGGACFALQADGKVFFGGSFEAYGAVPRSKLARLFADGTLDASFDPGVGPNDPVVSVAVAPDGKVLVAGDFDEWNGQPSGRLVRLNADGTLDASFQSGSGADERIAMISMDDQERILVGGMFLNFNGAQRNHIARLASGGALDPLFTTSPGASGGFLTAAVRDANGRIVIGGNMTEFDGIPVPNIARLLPDGSLDPSFDPGAGPNDFIEVMVSQPDGRILVGGRFMEYDGVSRPKIARILVDGSLDPSFDPGGGVSSTFQSIFALATLPDGKLLAGGGFTMFNGVAVKNIVRLNSDGSIDPSFQTGVGPNNTVAIIMVQPDGKVMVGGHFTEFNGLPRGKVVRLSANGSVDNSFESTAGANGQVNSIVQLADGGYLIAGFFTEYDGVPCGGIARLLSNGALDPSFALGAGGDFAVLNILQLPDERFVAVGNFTTFDGVMRKRVVRLHVDGSVDMDFDPGEGANGSPVGILLQVDGGLVLYGRTTFYEGVSRNNILRVRNTLITSVEEREGDGQPFAYPNPATGRVQLQEVTGAQRIHVSDATGRLCLDLPFKGNLDLSSLSKGAYLITALDRSGMVLRHQRQLLN
ncbi:MAG: hypothetical protein ABIY71_03010 [Flavobacteriales bacterium]